MKLGSRIFFCFLLIFSLCFYYPISWVLDNLRTRYLEGVEDPLVDQANILAGVVGSEMQNLQFDPQKWQHAFEDAYSRSFSAAIYNLIKTDVDTYIYVTDKNGRVIFDSLDKANIGADFSKWRDVRLTLKGEYGARTTLKNAEDPKSSVLYVAAPILVNNKIAGVLTIAKPTTSINTFLENAKPQIFKVGSLALLAAVFLSYFVSLWIARPIKRLTRYADNIRQGKRVEFPNLDHSEIGDMGQAFEKMQEALEGKKYVEQYVQKLTHEIKSPLSAIRGAAELLEEQMPTEQRTRFLSNIRNEANRIQKIVDRMLELAALESQKMLQKMEPVDFHTIIKTVIESKQPLLSKKHLQLYDQVPDNIVVLGDSFLLHQAISNLVQNAIDFSPDSGQINLTCHVTEKLLEFTVCDNGVGIPDYATNKVFEKFFSLQRPESGKKSTGLGLNLVKEVAALHNGQIELANQPAGGTQATLVLPL